jgi:ribosomal protein S27AE
MTEYYGRRFTSTGEVRAAGPFTADQVRELLAEHRDLGLEAMVDLRQMGCPSLIFERLLTRRAAKVHQFVADNTGGKTDAERRAWAVKMSQAIAADDSDDSDGDTAPEEFLGQTVSQKACVRCGSTRVIRVGLDQFYCSRCGSADPFRTRGE